VSGIQLIAAELGRVAAQLTWILTLQLPNQNVTTVHASVDPGVDAFSDTACDAIAARVVQHLL